MQEVPMSVRTALAILALGVLAAKAAPDDRPAPGRSTRTMEGLVCEFLVPPEEDAKENGGYSLLIILHGAGGTATGMVACGQRLLEKGFVTCAPKSQGQTWMKPDLDAVKKITRTLIEAFEVSESRRHAAGFSNGGWNLDPIAWDEELHFRTATWIAAGCRNASAPRWAVREMGVLALAGGEDPNRGAAEATVRLLEKKVKFVDCRIQPGLDHKYPRELEPYWHYFMEVLEGRFEPGRQLSYDWVGDLDAARATMEEKRCGGFVYVWSGAAEEEELEQTRILQNEALFGRLTSFYGRQLVAVKLEKEAAAALLAEEKVKATPAVLVYKPGGDRVVKVLSGKIRPVELAKALRSVAKDRSIPR
jgi:predicted esterase